MRAVAIIPLCVCLLSSAFAKPPLVLNYQDGEGQYNFGYSDPLSMRTESRTVDGVTRGTYSYYDQNGAIQTTEYEAGKDIGFRVKATNLPEAPLPVDDTAEVKNAREKHLKLLEEATRLEEEEKRRLSQANKAKTGSDSSVFEASAITEAKIAPFAQDKEVPSPQIIPAVDVRSQFLPEPENMSGASLKENSKSAKIYEPTPQTISALPLQQNQEQTANLRAQPLSSQPSAPAPQAPQAIVQKQQELSSKDLPNQGPLLQPNVLAEQRAFAAQNPFLIPFLGQGFSFESGLSQQRGLPAQQGQEKITAENINSELPAASIQSRISEQSAIPKQFIQSDQHAFPGSGIQGQPGSQIQNIFSNRAFSNQNGSPSGISAEQFAFPFPGVDQHIAPNQTPLTKQRTFPTQNELLEQQRLTIQGVLPQQQLGFPSPNGFSGQQGFPTQDALLQQRTESQTALPKQQGLPTINTRPEQAEQSVFRQSVFPEQRTVLAQGGLPNSQVFPSASGFFGQGFFEQNPLLRQQGFLAQQGFSEQQTIPRQNVISEQQQGISRQGSEAQQQINLRQNINSEQQVKQSTAQQQKVTPQQVVSRNNIAPEQQQGAISGQQFIQQQSSILEQQAIPRQNVASEQQGVIQQQGAISGQQFIQQQSSILDQQAIPRQNIALEQQDAIPQQGAISGQQFIQQQSSILEQQAIPRQNVPSEQQDVIPQPGAISEQQFIQQQNSILEQQSIPRQNVAPEQHGAIPQQGAIHQQGAISEQQFIQQQRSILEQRTRQIAASEQHLIPQQRPISGNQFIQQQSSLFEQQAIPRLNAAIQQPSILQPNAISEQQCIQQQRSFLEHQPIPKQNLAPVQQLYPQEKIFPGQHVILQQDSISEQQISRQNDVPEQKENTQQNAIPGQQRISQQSFIPDQQAIARQFAFPVQHLVLGQQGAMSQIIAQTPSIFDQQTISRFNAISGQQSEIQNQVGLARQSITEQQSIRTQSAVPEQRGVPQNLTPGQKSLPKGFPERLDQFNLQAEPSNLAAVRVPEPIRLATIVPHESVKYTPEVMAARAAHFRAYATAARLAEESDRNPQILIQLLKGSAANDAQVTQSKNQANEGASRSAISSTSAPIIENLNTKSAEETQGKLPVVLPEAAKAPEQRIESLVAESAQAVEPRKLDSVEKLQPFSLPNDIEQPKVRTGKSSRPLSSKVTARSSSENKWTLESTSSMLEPHRAAYSSGLTPASTSLRVMDTRLPSLNEFQQSKLKEALALTHDTPLKVAEDKETKTKSDQHLLIVKPVEIAPIATQKVSSMQQPVPKNWAFQYAYL